MGNTRKTSTGGRPYGRGRGGLPVTGRTGCRAGDISRVASTARRVWCSDAGRAGRKGPVEGPGGELAYGGGELSYWAPTTGRAWCVDGGSAGREVSKNKGYVGCPGEDEPGKEERPLATTAETGWGEHASAAGGDEATHVAANRPAWAKAMEASRPTGKEIEWALVAPYGWLPLRGWATPQMQHRWSTVTTVPTFSLISCETAELGHRPLLY